jgi:flagellar biosynthesis GTPase FlhF
VLVDGASMPREAELPDDLNQLVNRNALQVNLHSYNSGAKRMISQLELALRKAEEKRKQEAITKAAWEKEEREHKEREERAQRENEAREKTEAEERARFAAEQKAKKEREDRERRESEEKARKEKEAHKKAEAEKRARLAAKRKWLSLGIFLFICLLFEGIYLFQIWPITTVTATPLPTNLPPSNPSIGSTWLQTKDGSTMVYVPAGEFQMGSETGEEDEKPVHTVNLDAFWIDQTEVTNKMFTSFLNAKGNQSDGGEMVGLRRR